jgi:hypothetical protein
MEFVFSLLAEIVAVVIVVSGIQFTVLAFRNPHRPQWMRSGLSEALIVLAIVTGISFSVAMLISGLENAGVHVIPAVIAGVLFPLAVVLANEKIFGIRKRLRWAADGQSPFRSQAAARQPAAG